MIFLQGLAQGIAQLWIHKVRSLLSIACVSLGVASFIIVSGLIEGMFSAWETAITSMGGLEEITTADKALPADQRHLEGASEGRTLRDVTALRDLASWSDLVSPELKVETPVTRRDKAFFGSVRGVDFTALAANDLAVARGRFLSDIDQRDALPVIVLGSSPAKALFKEDEDPLGQIVRVKDQTFTVVGLLEHYERFFFGDNLLEGKNRMAFVPLTTALRRLADDKKLTGLTLRTRDVSLLPQTIDQAQNVLHQTHEGLEDFEIRTKEDEFAEFETTRRNWFAAGVGIALISLVVGGIGIMNLMLASIHERIREIGLRKAIGAWNRDIFVLFVAEALSLTLVGGLFGILVGMGVISVLGLAMAQLSPPVFSLNSAVAGLAFSIATGLFAGIYPALEAARMDPIEALRQE